MKRKAFRSAGTTVAATSLAVALQLAVAGTATAQDAVGVDGKHYKVEFENDQVRVLRVNYGPYEKSVMHSHPAHVAIFLTDGQVRFTLPDDKVVDAGADAGAVRWNPSGSHQPENAGEKAMDIIVVELKDSAAAAQ